MRSELVFAANDAVSNRFLLCRIVSASTRKFHGATGSMHETINSVLETISPHTVENLVTPVKESELAVSPDPSSEVPMLLATEISFDL